MGLRRLAVIGLAVLAACSAAAPQPMTVASDRFPAVAIECGGGPGLTQNECRAWAEQLLANQPIAATRLVLTHRTGNSRCAADYFAANGLMLVTASVRCPGP